MQPIWDYRLAAVFCFVLSQVHGQFSSGTEVADIFPQLKDLQLNPAPIKSLHLGGQNFDHCCLVAVNQSLAINQDGNLTKIGNPSFIVDDIETFQRSQFPCAASYNNDRNGTPIVKVPYKWCRDTCPGWQRSQTSDLNQWVNPFAGFIIPAVVFCLSVPRQRKIAIPETLFDIPFNRLVPILSVPFIALIAGVIVTVDTMIWLMVIFALAGPILLSGIFEAFIDNRILAYLQNSIENHRLTTEQRARLIYTVLTGNLNMLKEPPKEIGSGNTAWKDVADLLRRLQFEGPQGTKTRLRTILSAQYSFGVTVGAPVIFFGASFVYTLVGNYANYGNVDTSNALAFGEYWQIIPHIAIVSGLLLAGNNPNVLEGIVCQPQADPEPSLYGFFAPVYESRYQPAWIWQRGRSKKIWFQKVCKEYDASALSLEEKLRVTVRDWLVVSTSTILLLAIPALLAFLTMYYFKRSLSCRAMTALVYLICQMCLIGLWIWDIESTKLSSDGRPITPATDLSSARRFMLEPYIWYCCVIITGTCAVFVAIGGTLMQIIGVSRNCSCMIALSEWTSKHPQQEVIISTYTGSEIESAMTWWTGTGTSAVAFLGAVALVGWWYQRRLRYDMKDLIERIDDQAEGLSKPVSGRNSV